MKKLLSISCLVLSITFFSTSHSYAQNDLSITAGAAYGLEVEAPGIQVGAVYGFTDNLRGAADISFYFPDSPNNGDYTFWELNINAHYLFISKETTNFYGLAGLNYATQKISGGGMSISSSEAGLNIGAGAEFGVGFGAIYVEGKYALSNYDQLALAAGVRFGI